MPRYYCDYCDTYLTHDSPSVRKQHNAGYKHKANVRSYYQQFEEQQTQSLIDQRIKEHLGQTAAFQQQVGASFNQHLMAFQSNPQGPRFPVLAPPVLPIGGPMGSQLLPGIRPPVLPRPPGYGASPNLPPSMPPHGPLQMGGLPRPPPPASNGPQVMYQANPTATETGGFGNFIPSSTPGVQSGAPINAPEDGFSYPQSLETDH